MSLPCHTRTRVALPEGSPPAAGGAQNVVLKVNESVRVTLRDGSQLNGLVSAIELDALTMRGRRDRGPATDRRILWSDSSKSNGQESVLGATRRMSRIRGRDLQPPHLFGPSPGPGRFTQPGGFEPRWRGAGRAHQVLHHRRA